MATDPKPNFTHLHCSSRFDRSAASLEADLDKWMAQVGLITVTEVSGDNRAAQLREKGWNYFNAKRTQGQDECAVAWNVKVWHRSAAAVLKLNNDAYYRRDGRVADPVVSCTVILRRADTGHRIMVSVTHMPAHVEGKGGWRTTENKWRARKEAYLSSLTNWHTHLEDLERKYKTDATLVIADWNLNLKETWVRNLLKSKFTTKYKQAWKQFPTQGGSLSGGHNAPPGAPGHGYGDRIIDGTMYRGLKVPGHPVLMAAVASSDHRPYREGFEFAAKAGHPDPTPEETQDESEGNVYHGEAWWGFGDYIDDEIYQIDIATGLPGGEVL